MSSYSYSSLLAPNSLENDAVEDMSSYLSFDMEGLQEEYSEPPFSSRESPGCRQESANQEDTSVVGDSSKQHSVLGSNVFNHDQSKLSRTKPNLSRSRSAKIAFKTKSDVEVLDDGYKWRKYGKKMVKNSPNPRNYYRCSREGCHVKKRIERAPEDLRYIVTTYEGIHNHHAPLPASSDKEASATRRPAASPAECSHREMQGCFVVKELVEDSRDYKNMTHPMSPTLQQQLQIKRLI